MTRANVFSRGIGMMRRRRNVALAALGVLLIAAGAAFAFQAFSDDEGAIVAAAANTTPTPTVPAPTATPARTPTPTPVPTSVAAPGGTPGPHPPGQYFPPPPPRTGPIPANKYGIERITAPELGVDHYVEVLGVTNGTMDSPNDGSYAVGYYPDFSQVPGESGNAIFSAHETWNHLQGPFYQMHKAEAGDEIFVHMTDGRTLRYVVLASTRYDVDSIPMAEVVWPKRRAIGEQWITLITCGGRIVYDATGFGEYLDRDVVIARLAPQT